LINNALTENGDASLSSVFPSLDFTQVEDILDGLNSY